MKYSILALTLTLTAILLLADREETAAGRTRRAQHGSESPESPADRSQASKDTKLAGEPQSGQKAEAKAEPLLLLDDDPPLLLDDDPPLLLDDDDGNDPSASGGRVADNSRCHVCHLNYEEENIAVVHAKEDIGCTDCHGKCDEHIADESWASGGNGTPPGKMYRHKEIDPCCKECHESHDAPARKVISRWQNRCAKDLKKIGLKTIVCTDCHGEHRLKERKCKWK